MEDAALTYILSQAKGPMEALLFTGCLIICLRVANDIRSMANSVGELNTKIAVILEKIDGHERRLEVLEDYRG